MYFSNSLEDNLEHLEIYHLLEDEMSKYKTLNHEKIKWDKVYEYSLEILQKYSMNAKICNYFVLSCMTLNNKESFEIMDKMFATLADVLQNSPENSDKSADFLKKQKKKIKSIVEYFIIESDKLNLSHLAQTIMDFNHTFKLLGGILGCDFKEIQVQQEQQKDKITTSTIIKPAEFHIQTPNATALNDREYRIFFNNLAFELLENNQENLNAYALFVEAMWGRINMLPPHNENITQIKYPDKNLIQILLQDNVDTSELEHIKLFMSNLILNPFWIEGLKFFCEFLQKHKRIIALKLLGILTKSFLMKFKEISNLKFKNGEPMCQEQIFNYFMKQDRDSNHRETKINQNKPNHKKNIDEILLEINAQNYNDSVFCNVNALLEMARVFEEKNMHNNAKMLYAQLKDLMENTPLKDYLLEEYLKAKAKSEKI